MSPIRRTGKRRDWTQQLTAVGSIGAVLVAVAALLLTSAANRDQQRISERGQITERFSKSVEQLGSEILGVRLGGIYGLERIMKDSMDDEPAILEVLCAYVRDQSKKVQRPSANNVSPAGIGTDIQAILTVIARRPDPTNIDHRVDLSGAHLAGATLGEDSNLYAAILKDVVLKSATLSGVNLEAADLTGAVLDDANLGEARLSKAKLVGAKLLGANLDHATLSEAQLNDALLKDVVLNGGTLMNTVLFRADLEGARLIDARLNGAFLGRANLTGAKLNGADLSGADLNHADLTGADLGGANLTGADLAGAIISDTTKLSR